MKSIFQTTRRDSRGLCLSLLAFALAPSAWAATETLTGSGSWLVPAGVTSVTVEMWGGGGGGGAETNAAAAGCGGGGGGGGYSRATIVTTPGGSIAYAVGAGGTGGTADGLTAPTAGGDSTFVGVTTAAGGGAGANSTASATAGTAGTGGTANGGAGQAGSPSGQTGGAGGGAGGFTAPSTPVPGAAGGSVTTRVGGLGGGTAPSKGGDGASIVNATNGNPGGAPGGGGSGGSATSSSTRPGGNGGNGTIILTYIAAGAPPSVTSQTATHTTPTTATLGASVNETISGYGVVYSQTSVNSNPQVGGTGVTQSSMGSSNPGGAFSGSVTGLTPGTQYSYAGYAVNANGTGYSPVGTFYSLVSEPTVQASNVSFTSTQRSSFTINWTRGNGSDCIVLVKAGSAVDSAPVDGTTYTASTDLLTPGSQIGTGNYVVYSGTGTSVTLSSLTLGTTYHVAVYELNGSAGSQNYLTTSPAINSAAATGNIFYSTGSVDPTIAANWNSATDGSGTAATSFTGTNFGGVTSGDVFTIQSGHTMTATALWTVSGVGATVVINSGGKLDMATNALKLAGNFINNGIFVSTGNASVTFIPNGGPSSSNFTSTYTFRPGVSTVGVLVQGSGGGGGGGASAYSSSVAVAPTTDYTVTVGVGGQRGTNTGVGTAGANSQLSGGSITAIIANGGAGGANSSTGGAGGAGGAAGSSGATANFAGGNGAVGGGGGGAGETGAGAAATAGFGGVGGSGTLSPGGVGGDAGLAGTAPGGGGGGGNNTGAAVQGLSGSAGQVLVIYPAAAAPTVIATAATEINSTTATLGVNVTSNQGADLTARGTVWGTSPSPVSNALAEGGTTTGIFTQPRTGLPAGTLIYYRGYATNAIGTSYSADASFYTLSQTPTSSSSGMTFTGVGSNAMTVNWTSGNGNRRIVIAKQGSAPSGTPTDATQYSASATYGSGAALAGGYVVYDGTGNSVAVTGLSAGFTYYFVVYEYNWDLTHAATIHYLTATSLSGSRVTNVGAPTVSSPTASAITTTSATLGATVDSDGGAALTARGTVWGTSPSPTLNVLAQGGTTTGTFTHSRIGLPAGTLIYYRGYATNSGGTGYSADGTFHTLSTQPTSASSGMGFASVSQTGMAVNWTSGSGNRRIVIARAGSAPNGAPVNGTQYSASATYGSGAALAGGYVVYDGTGNSVAVTGLSAETTYHFAVYEYNWNGTQPATINYLTSASLSGSQASLVAFRTLTITAVNGSVNGDAAYVNGTVATLTATPNPGYVFSGWTGDASGTENPLSLTMDADKTIGATFAQDLGDTDGDGLSNYRETVVYGTDPAKSDSDDDGLSDAWELGVGRFSLATTTTQLTWQQARNDAHSKGGDLACFPTEDMWTLVRDSLGETALDALQGVWIGASDAEVEGTWKWVNGLPFTFANWGAGRPSTTVGNSLDFLEISGGDGAAVWNWYDRSASSTRPCYLLEVGYSTNPLAADTDGDGLSDGEEATANTHPFLSDTDGDGLSDGEEAEVTLTDPTQADSDGDGTGDATDDQDSDGLGNLAEIATHFTNPTVADTDGDGLSDGEEVQVTGTQPTQTDSDGDGTSDADEDADGDGLANLAELRTHLTNPSVADSDGDGLSDGQEVNLALTNPNQADSDSDGTGDATDDQDSDGLGNLAEIATHFTNPTVADTDGDGLSDGEEVQLTGTQPTQTDSDGNGTSDADEDADGDGLANLAELRTHLTNPSVADSDGDGLSDGQEVNLTLTNPNQADSDGDGTNDAADDQDGDGLGNLAEIATHFTNPTVADTDGDGLSDGAEINSYGTNPSVADSDGDGLSDGQEVTGTLSNPLQGDSDDDGLTDGAEVNTHGSNPLLADSDDDGLDDRAEVEVHLSNPTLKDSDGDGFEDGYEVTNGFNPASATSTPETQTSIRTAVEFRFNAANGVSYRIEDSTNLQNWNIVEDAIIGQGGMVTRFYSTENQPKRYFRVRRN